METPELIVHDKVMVFDLDVERAAKIAASLNNLPARKDLCDSADEALTRLRRDPPRVAVVVGADQAFPGLASTAKSLGVATLALVDLTGPSGDLPGLIRGYDDWASLSGPGAEVSLRVNRLMESEPEIPELRPPGIDSRFLALAVHDLRTPLNVIVLTNRAIAHSVSEPTSDFKEDLVFLTENARQLERMLSHLGDYCRLLEAEAQVSGTEFDPRRFLSDFLEDRRDRSSAEATPVRLDLEESSPREVSLDPIRVRLALQYALANAVAAAGDSSVRIRSSGKTGRWIVEMTVDKPPPDSVTTTGIRSDSFERLLGVAAERRGLDLAIAARVSELFGGTTRLEVESGRRSTIILDWPERLVTP